MSSPTSASSVRGAARLSSCRPADSAPAVTPSAAERAQRAAPGSSASPCDRARQPQGGGPPGQAPAGPAGGRRPLGAPCAHVRAGSIRREHQSREHVSDRRPGRGARCGRRSRRGPRSRAVAVRASRPPAGATRRFRGDDADRVMGHAREGDRGRRSRAGLPVDRAAQGLARPTTRT